MAKAFTNWNIEHVNNLLKSGKIRGFVDSKPKNNPRSKKLSNPKRLAMKSNTLIIICLRFAITMATR